MEPLGFRASFQPLQRVTQPGTAVALPVARDPQALLPHAIAEAAGKLDRINAVSQKLDDSQSGLHATGELDLPELNGKADQQIEADNIRAREAIYFGEMFESMRMPKVADRLVELFQNGLRSIGTPGSGSTPERNTFFSGRLLGASDLEGEQQYRGKESVVAGDDFTKLSARIYSLK
jgi:hypothetical protein